MAIFLLGASIDEVPPSGLKYIVAYYVVNPNTADVVLETIRSSNSTVEKVNSHKEITGADDGFYALSGSVLGSYLVFRSAWAFFAVMTMIKAFRIRCIISYCEHGALPTRKRLL